MGVQPKRNCAAYNAPHLSRQSVNVSEGEMALEQIRELANEVQDLQASPEYSAEPDKMRALASLTLELAKAVQDIHDRLRKLEEGVARA